MVGVMAFQSRTELAGEDRKPAASLHLKVTTSNDILALFDKGLKAAFYRKQLKEEQDLADQGAAADSGLNRIKFPHSDNVVEWDEKFTLYTTTVQFGIDEKTHIVLPECTAEGFKFEMRDGGTILLSLKISAHPDADQAGILHTLNGSEVTFSLEPPEDKQGNLA